MTRRCLTCGARFEARGAWQKKCWECWRRARAQDLYDDGYEAGYRNGLRAGLRASRSRPPAVGPPAPELLRAAVALCHPDRHPPERAPEANRVTAELIELLEEARRVA